MIKRRSRIKKKKKTPINAILPFKKEKTFAGDGLQAVDYVPQDYNDGANGMIWWVEENVRVKIEIDGETQHFYMGELPETINPETGRKYNNLWEEQKIELRKALEMKNGRFIYTIIVLCWMRGEGKSFLVCLIQLWKFFCFDHQQIMLGANNKDQSKFVHFGIMQAIVLNSPNLLNAVGGEKNVQEKEIRIKDEKGEIISFIRPMSTSTGIVSNITGYSFSEIFDMKNPKFFEQLDGSIRNITNALGVIDSTVSDKSHLLYKKLYLGCKDKSLKTCYFSHRQSKDANYRDYWHPNMTQMQLDSYKAKFSLTGFDQYFRNTWESGRHRVFSVAQIRAMGYFGVNNIVGNHNQLMKNMTHVAELEEDIKDIDSHPEVKDAPLEKRMGIIGRVTDELTESMWTIKGRCQSIAGLYSLESTIPEMPDVEVIEKLTEMYKTDWALGVGLDFGDSLAVEQKANTMGSLILKGLPNSLINEDLLLEKNAGVVQYLYFLLHIKKFEDHDLDKVKVWIDECSDTYNDVDAIGVERYRSWDLKNWCEERDIVLNATHPSYPKQLQMFQVMYNAIDSGHFKTPPVGIFGVNEPDILVEEFEAFDHDTYKKRFGSPTKFDKDGVQDDTVYASGWGIVGMQEINALEFRNRTAKGLSMEYIPPA